MNKNQKGFVSWFLVAAIAVVIVATGAYVVYRHHQSNNQAAQNISVSCNPCSSNCPDQYIPGIVMTHVASNINKQQLETLIQPIHGKLSPYYNNVEINSDYHEISVPYGSETKAISYLKKQSVVIDAWQESPNCPN